MSGTPLWGLQQAIKTRLLTDATLVTLVGSRVYDDPPAGSAFPYVVLGDVTEVPNDTMGTTGREITITVHTWSQYQGMKQVFEIQDRIDRMLDRWAATVSGWAITQSAHEFFETLRDPDGITRHGVARYRIYARQT